ncbi:MAG: 2-oxoacid:acceptor oxidoreductase family protein [Deltaproteobacteria bacterium]|nr:2-oxoacid:acceptor oxidoreductase family protein [Deltaproteobacteria bacterium]
MLEIRIHGRGGQGAVVASKILSDALFREGNVVQAFPIFGVERRGAPVAAFLRCDKSPIYLRSEIYHPDMLIILDHTLVKNQSVFAGLKEGGLVLINSKNSPDHYKGNFRFAAVDANAVAVENGLGSPNAPIVNTAILGAFARASGICSIESIKAAIMDNAPVKPEQNAKAAEDAYVRVRL